MALRVDFLRVVILAASCTSALSLVTVSCTSATSEIRAWKVGSPHRGDTPPQVIPNALSENAAAQGVGFALQTFPAEGFASRFAEAVKQHSSPDVIVIDNMGIVSGITTTLGQFSGIGQTPETRKDLVQVTGSFDMLLGPQRGWTYLHRRSPNYAAAKALALRRPGCPTGNRWPQGHADLERLVPRIVTAYLRRDSEQVRRYGDADRLSTPAHKREPAKVGTVQLCGLWGNDKLAFATVNASYEAESALGHVLVLTVLRKAEPQSQWKLLVASRDPISTGTFLQRLYRTAPPRGAPAAATSRIAESATLLSPPPGVSPVPDAGERFGMFTWRSSSSLDVLMEVAEFAYSDDARLLWPDANSRGELAAVSDGQLWNYRPPIEWKWRVWSISSSGDVAFSGSRPLPH